jgi:hypothetical protein
LRNLEALVAEVQWMKSIIRILIALFGAFFGSLQINMISCRHGIPERPWSHWFCENQLWTWPVLLLVLFTALMLLLGKHFVAFRRPISVFLLLLYGVYGILYAIEWRVWWPALVPIGSVLAAVGIALRKVWGRLIVCAFSLVFTLYWCWSVAYAVLSGYMTSVRPLEAALSLVPGIAFVLLAGFCCYVTIQQRNSETGWV